MSKKPENQFIDSVHRHLPTSVYHMKLHNPYISGPADCWYSAKRDAWIEYKFIVLPKRADTLIVPDLSDLQMDWCGSRLNEGRNVFVIVGCREGGVVLRDPKLWKGGLSQSAFLSQLQARGDLARLITKEVS